MRSRRLARRLFTLCSALSLVLCVAVVLLWARSYKDQGDRTTLIGRDLSALAQGGSSLRFASKSGHTHWAINEHAVLFPSASAVKNDGGSITFSGTTSFQNVTVTPCSCGHTAMSADVNGRRVRNVMLPFWALAATTAIPPGLWTYLRLSRYRRERCAECGAVAEGKVTA